VFKKYSPIGELSNFATQYAESLARATSFPVIICDRDHCVAASGISKKEVLERRVSPSLEEIMEHRKSVNFEKNENHPALEGVECNIKVGVPIINAGDVSGAVVLVGDASDESAKESDIKLAGVAADFLGKQME
jgi:AbrB family transcriptional regulator (stage V sporulation protein T)